MAGRGPAGVDDGVVVEVPLRREGRGVHLGQLGPLGPARPPDPSWRPRRLVGQRPAEQDELLERVQTGLAVGPLVVLTEGRGADPVVAEAGEPGHPAADLLGRREHGARHRQDLGRRRVRGPRTHPDRGAARAQHHVGHAEAAGESDHPPDGSVRPVGLLFATHPRYLDHVASPNHPERPARLEAVLQGAHQTPVADALVPLEPRPATRAELERVHPAEYLDELERISEEEGGGWLDPDTGTSEASWEACRLGAGAVLAAAEALSAGEGEAAFCAVRPPGHHATRQHAMGFCLVNNVAVTAAALGRAGRAGADRRLRRAPRQRHPGHLLRAPDASSTSRSTSGRCTRARARWASAATAPDLVATSTFPCRPRATGDVYLAGLDRIVAPLAEVFEPTWLIISAGFDAHRRDPLTDLGLSAGDYALHDQAAGRARADRPLHRRCSKAATTSRRWPTPSARDDGRARRRRAPARGAHERRPRPRVRWTPSAERWADLLPA